jgi:hypothetical protein
MTKIDIQSYRQLQAAKGNLQASLNKAEFSFSNWEKIKNMIKEIDCLLEEYK